jgi:hypothetical protein
VENSAPSSFPSLPNRLLQVFVSPGELFTALREKPVWFGALAVCGFLAVLSIVLIPTELWVELSRNQLIERGQEVPAGVASSGSIIRIFAVLGGGISFFIMAFVLAGIVTLFFSFLFGDEGRYVQYLSVVAHASVISALGALLLVPLKLSQGDPSVTLSLGTFAFFIEDGYPLRVLKLLDLFALWSYGVMAIGVTKIDPKRGFGSALTFFFTFALVFALIFGTFGG